jgi:hypothetical protein
MSKFIISQEDLLAFAQKVYNEACYGYFDLCVPITEKMLSEFLLDKQKFKEETIEWHQFAPRPLFQMTDEVARNQNFIGNISERI